MNPTSEYAVWRPDKRNPGKWILLGYNSLLSDRRGPIKIMKNDGTYEHRRVIWNSNPFLSEGIPHCFARVEEKRFCEGCGGMHLRAEMGYAMDWALANGNCDCRGKLAKKEAA